MSARKLLQEVDRCFKKVTEGVAEFESIYEKIEQSSNQAQKEKLEDNLKREIKKLQRLRDQIKTWAASNDIKDKGPLLDNRKLIETQMEKFKAVEKAMKTKAYSKEGLSAAAKLDPKEQAKAEASEFLGNMIDALEQQIESIEAEAESIQATVKKGKARGQQADRIAHIERVIERHKWHQGKLELIRRSLENGGVEADQVQDIEDNIQYYVSDGMNEDFMEDDTLYEDLALGEGEEAAFGMNQDNDKGSSQDTQSIQDDHSPEESRATPAAGSAAAATAAAAAPIMGKPRSAAEAAISAGRRPSTQLKSPLPTLATLHTPLPTIGNGPASSAGMKPASVPTRPAGEGLKYASAAAAAAASDKSGVGIAPLPPPPGALPVSLGAASSLPQSAQNSRTSAANSPSAAPALPAAAAAAASAAPQAQQPPSAPVSAAAASISLAKTDKGRGKAQAVAPSTAAAPVTALAEAGDAPKAPRTNGVTNGVKSKGKQQQQQQQLLLLQQQQQLQQQQSQPQQPPLQTPPEATEEESIYHLPAALRDLVESLDTTKKLANPPNSLATLRGLTQSQASQPDLADADAPPSYQPELRVQSTAGYPEEPLPIFNDPRLYSRLDTDTLFYIFYYKQGTHQQYLAAKALKDQSWRFHKQYQTWFQRHEEPKNITEEFEQGTYRFFDYESTWMNRRKADFKFAYKYLEDDV